MTAPAIATDRTAGRGARRPAARQGVDRWAGLVEGYFRLHAALTYAFLFLPIIVVVVLAFNATTKATTVWEGFSPAMVLDRPGRRGGPRCPDE